MRKIKYLMLLCMVAFTMTGCVKYNATMDIKKDKSMNFSMIYAIDKTIFADTKAIDDDDQKTLKDAGFKIEDYKDGNMVGFKVSKEIKNIDDVSKDGKTNYDLSGLIEEKGKTKDMFTVKKGFFKNTYKASFKFDSSDSEFNTSTKGDDEETPIVYDDEDDEDTTILDDSEDIDMPDFSKMGSSMDLSFNVKLPYKAVKNNATKVDDDKKSLKWELASTGPSDIEFEFELYNMTNIYLTIGGCVLLLAVIAFVVVSKIKKGKKSTPEVE